MYEEASQKVVEQGYSWECAKRNFAYSNVLMYIQQDVTLRSLCYLETALHISGGTSTHH